MIAYSLGMQKQILAVARANQIGVLDADAVAYVLFVPHREPVRALAQAPIPTVVL